MGFIIGLVVGVALCLLVQKFIPAKWSKLTAEADKVIDQKK
jgi:uncharacterized membrane-anchored protein YhcB (DUF1043 family)